MNVKTITDKLFEQADIELELRLKNLFNEVRHEFTDGRAHSILVKGVEVDAHESLTELMKLSFEMQKEANRQAKIDEFMSKVKSLTQGLNELRELEES